MVGQKYFKGGGGGGQTGVGGGEKNLKKKKKKIKKILKKAPGPTLVDGLNLSPTTSTVRCCHED